MITKIKRIFLSRTVRSTLADGKVTPGSPLESRVEEAISMAVDVVSSRLGDVHYIVDACMLKCLECYPYTPKVPMKIVSYWRLSSDCSHLRYVESLLGAYATYIRHQFAPLKTKFSIPESELNAYIRKKAPECYINKHPYIDEEMKEWQTNLWLQ